jgi:hypothetical protein
MASVPSSCRAACAMSEIPPRRVRDARIAPRCRTWPGERVTREEAARRSTHVTHSTNTITRKPMIKLLLLHLATGGQAAHCDPARHTRIAQGCLLGQRAHIRKVTAPRTVPPRPLYAPPGQRSNAVASSQKPRGAIRFTVSPQGIPP